MNDLHPRLSVNINKIATLRNARGGFIPDVVRAAKNAERFGAEGITVHPRPDERHIRYEDVRQLSEVVTTEFNVEGYPTEDFLKLVEEVRPAQVTLVPDSPDVLTSNAGWDTLRHQEFLKRIVNRLHQSATRVSLFIDSDENRILAAAETGADRVELYTEAYATRFEKNPEDAIAPYVSAAEAAGRAGLGLNAGHDLNLDNLNYFAQRMPGLLEVSIGHALISDALYLGLENAVQRYLQELRKP